MSKINELAKMAKKGDKKALDDLYSACQSALDIATKLFKRKFPTFSIEDCKSEVNYIFMLAINTFDSSRSSFRTYLSRLLDHPTYKGHLSSSTLQSDVLLDVRDPGADLERQAMVKDLVKKGKALLCAYNPQLWRYVEGYYLLDMTYAEMARKWTGKVENARKIKRRVEASLRILKRRFDDKR